MKLKLENFVNSALRPLLASENDQKPSLWIFGYGSLIWNPGFEYDQQEKARLRGYTRRFYQGNTTYRGTVEHPGRVVTIVEDDQDRDTYGLAFKVRGWSQVTAALDHLHIREIQSGYAFRIVQMELLESGETVQALTCIALKENALFMAPATSQSRYSDDEHLEIMAYQIATAAGKAGPNHEYLSKLADSMRLHFPNAWDEHLFQLETLMRQFMNATTHQHNEFVELRTKKVQAS